MYVCMCVYFETTVLHHDGQGFVLRQNSIQAIPLHLEPRLIGSWAIQRLQDPQPMTPQKLSRPKTPQSVTMNYWA